MVRTGPSEVTLLENERWASPVSDEIKEALRLELQRRLAQTDCAHAFTKANARHRRATSRGGTRAVRTDRGVLDVQPYPPRVSDRMARGLTTCTFHANEKIQTGYAGMVEGYQARDRGARRRHRSRINEPSERHRRSRAKNRSKNRPAGPAQKPIDFTNAGLNMFRRVHRSQVNSRVSA